MKTDNLKKFLDKINAGGLPLGAVTTFTDVAVTEVIAAAGFDFVWVDGEHGVIDRKTAQDHLIAAQACGLTYMAIKNDTNAMLLGFRQMIGAAKSSENLV